MAQSPFPHLWPWIVFWATLAQQGNLYLKYVKLFLRPHAQMYRYLESLTPSSNSRTTVPLSCSEWKIMFQVLSDAVLSFPPPNTDYVHSIKMPSHDANVGLFRGHPKPIKASSHSAAVLHGFQQPENHNKQTYTASQFASHFHQNGYTPSVIFSL